ncbi:MAG: hypothetical protein ACOC9Y_05730 [Chloroflexota bacterium]
MVTTNGTDEGVLRDWLDREFNEWSLAFVRIVDETIEHLQEACFTDAWQALEDKGVDPKDISDQILLMYEAGLVKIFAFLRSSGAILSDVAWSEFKAGRRRILRDLNAPEIIRNTMDNALYEAEKEELGDHDLYQSWARSIMLFLYHHAAQKGDEYPGPEAPDEDKFSWGYNALSDIENHSAFHEAFTAYVRDAGVRPLAEAVNQHDVSTILAHEKAMLDQPRFDLILNTGLVWLVGAVERN